MRAIIGMALLAAVSLAQAQIEKRDVHIAVGGKVHASDGFRGWPGRLTPASAPRVETAELCGYGGCGITEADALLAAKKRRYNSAVSESADLS